MCGGDSIVNAKLKYGTKKPKPLCDTKQNLELAGAKFRTLGGVRDFNISDSDETYSNLKGLKEQVISPFKFTYPCLALKEEAKVNSEHTRRYLAHDLLQIGFTLQTFKTKNK